MTTDPSSPTVLVSVPTEFEAGVIASALCEQQINATTTGGLTSGFKAEAPGEVAVVVPLSQLDDAKQVLASIRQEQSEIDWSQVDVGTPE